MNYQESIEYLLSLPDMERRSRGDGARTMSLEAMHALLAELGNPHLNRPTIHVTGSKGKGSTSNFISGILASAGITNSLYTSPHLHAYTERICFDLKPCSEQDFAQGVSEIQAAINKVHQGELGPISTFGAMSALFFQLTREHNLDWQIVEVGMGGLFDATNVFEKTDIVIITAVSLEHTTILGDTAAAIAENKAGIIRPGSTVVLAEQKDPQVLPIIEHRCAELGARLVNVAKEYKIEEGQIRKDQQTFRLSGKSGVRDFSLSMLGAHQLANAATAIAVADVIAEREPALKEHVIKFGLAEVVVPGRLEATATAPHIVLDGAHNGESARALAAGLKRHFSFDRLFVVLGVNSDKNIEEILEAFSNDASELIITRSQSEKAMDTQKIATAAKNKELKFQMADSAQIALQRASALASSNDLICVTGSLYLVGEARELLLSKSSNQTVCG